MTPCNFSELKGKTIMKIYGAEVGSDHIIFICDDGLMYMMRHEQDCCEEVLVEDVCGDLNCLVDREILKAEDTSRHEEEEDDISTTWTFYTLATVKGYVTIRWMGCSNGYYSESVDFERYRYN